MAIPAKQKECHLNSSSKQADGHDHYHHHPHHHPKNDDHAEKESDDATASSTAMKKKRRKEQRITTTETVAVLPSAAPSPIRYVSVSTSCSSIAGRVVSPLPNHHENEEPCSTNTTTSTGSMSCHFQQSKSKSQLQSLPDDVFIPNAYTVIVGRGKIPMENCGNKRLRILALTMVPQYRGDHHHDDGESSTSGTTRVTATASRSRRRDKTKIVRQLYQMIHSAGGKFVRRDKKSNNYVEVEERVAKEKIGYILRDLVGGLQYKSTSASKSASKKMKRRNARQQRDLTGSSR